MTNSQNIKDFIKYFLTVILVVLMMFQLFVLIRKALDGSLLDGGSKVPTQLVRADAGLISPTIDAAGFDTLEASGTYDPIFAADSKHADSRIEGYLYRVTHDDFSTLISVDKAIQQGQLGEGWESELLSNDAMWNPIGCASMPTAVVGDFVFVVDGVPANGGSEQDPYDHFVTRFDTRKSTESSQRYAFFAINSPVSSEANHSLVLGLKSVDGNLEMIFEYGDTENSTDLHRVSRLVTAEGLQHGDDWELIDQANVAVMLDHIETPIRRFIGGSSVYPESLDILMSAGLRRYFKEELASVAYGDPYIFTQTNQSVIASAHMGGGRKMVAIDKRTGEPSPLFKNEETHSVYVLPPPTSE